MASSLITEPREAIVPLSQRQLKTLFRVGKAKPDTTFLRQFPGKRRFERVNEEDFNAVLPVKDIAGFGHIGRLTGEVRVYTPKKDFQIARKWESRSYIRNFARILRNLFGQNVQLVDSGGGSVTVMLNNGTGIGGLGLTPEVSLSPGSFGATANPELSGAGFQIGNGVPLESHTRNALVAPVGPIISSRNNVRTSVQNTSTTTLEITTGITNSQAVTVNVTEIGLWLFFISNAVNRSVVPDITLIAYDGITSTPVATGGVIAPRYTLDFPV
jgi:hypothetical protein